MSLDTKPGKWNDLFCTLLSTVEEEKIQLPPSLLNFRLKITKWQPPDCTVYDQKYWYIIPVLEQNLSLENLPLILKILKKRAPRAPSKMEAFEIAKHVKNLLHKLGHNVTFIG